MIKRLKNGSYSVTLYYPVEVRKILGMTTKNFRKTCKTKSEAKKLEKDIQRKIDKVKKESNARAFEINANISFKKFYETVWLEMYEAGSSGRTRKIPSHVTVENTKDLFRLHILPMFGKYSIKYLNDNKDFVLRELTRKSQSYANIKVIKSYVSQLFEIAELLDYIEYNRVAKVTKFVAEPKKQRLKAERQLKGESLTAEQLLQWLGVVEEDYNTGKLVLQDYLLFMLTLHLGDRKSESYALQWKHVDLNENRIYLSQALDRYANVKATKGNKKSVMMIPAPLKRILLDWKKYQKKELFQFGIKQKGDQFLFTYTNRKGEINQRLHTDYLNRRMQVIQNRHPELTNSTPHKLRHTSATLAKMKGMSLEKISEGLTHSEIATTKIYVNDNSVIELTPASFAYDEIMSTAAK